MGKRRLTVAGTTGLALLLAAATAEGGLNRCSRDERLEHFCRGVEEYVQLHREVARRAPPVEPSSDAQMILDGVAAMRAGIRAARPWARPGELFDADAVALLRDRIHDTLAAAGETTAEILHRQRDPNPSAAPAPLVPNAEFPWAQGSYMPPVLFEVLPTLPPELQFRTVGRDLVLLDIDASMVVDVLTDALPPEEPKEHPGTRWALNSGCTTLSLVTGVTSPKHVIRPVNCQWAFRWAPAGQLSCT